MSMLQNGRDSGDGGDSANDLDREEIVVLFSVPEIEMSVLYDLKLFYFFFHSSAVSF